MEVSTHGLTCRQDRRCLSLSKWPLTPGTADSENTQVHLACFQFLPVISFPSDSLALFSLNPTEMLTSKQKVPS